MNHSYRWCWTVNHFRWWVVKFIELLTFFPLFILGRIRCWLLLSCGITQSTTWSSCLQKYFWFFSSLIDLVSRQDLFHSDWLRWTICPTRPESQNYWNSILPLKIYDSMPCLIYQAFCWIVWSLVAFLKDFFPHIFILIHSLISYGCFSERRVEILKALDLLSSFFWSLLCH